MKVWAPGERLLAGDLNGNFADPSNASGVWTPVVEGVTSPGVGTYTVQSGRYYRIGRLTFIEARIDWTAHTGTGAMRVTGLPFPIADAVALTLAARLAAAAAAVQATGVSGESRLSIINPASGGTVGMIAGAASLFISGAYRTPAP